jgi:hypothetical protein
MTRRALKPGTKYRDVLTSKFINELIQPEPVFSGTAGKGFHHEEVRIMGQHISGSATDIIQPYEVVLIVEPFDVMNTNKAPGGGLPQEVPAVPAVKVNKFSEFNSTTHGFNPLWGIAQGQISGTVCAPVLLSGVSHLKLEGTRPTTNLSVYKGIDIFNGVMNYDVRGRAEIIGSLSANGSHAIVHLTRKRQTSVFGRTINSIAPSSSGLFNLAVPSASYWTFSSVQLIGFNPHDTKTIAANRRIVASEVDGRWMIHFEACP